MNKIISNSSKTISDEDYNTLKSFLKEPDKIYYPKATNHIEGQEAIGLSNMCVFSLLSSDNIIHGIISLKINDISQFFNISIDTSKTVGVLVDTSSFVASSNGINIGVANQFETKEINLITSGTGSKALMDDGTYKEVSTGGGSDYYVPTDVSKELFTFAVNNYDQTDNNKVDTVSAEAGKALYAELVKCYNNKNLNIIFEENTTYKQYAKVTNIAKYTTGEYGCFISIIGAYGIPICANIRVSKDGAITCISHMMFTIK